MSRNPEFGRLVDDLGTIAPVGYALMLRIRFTAPQVLRTNYPIEWVNHYQAQKFCFRDPTILWGASNTGTIRWSEVGKPDPCGVLEQGRAWGLTYGVVAAVGPVTDRSIITAARAEREFTTEEMAKIAKIAEKLHILTEPAAQLSKTMIEALQSVRHGQPQEKAALELGISESDFNARLSSARHRLGARTTPEAVQIAQECGLL